MDKYGSFAAVYDLLMSDISYPERCGYINKLIEMYGGRKGILLDLACGTGTLSEEFAKIGYDVIGVDASECMLQEAIEKKIQSGLNIQYLCQDMTELDMYGTIDVTVCALDGLNHLDNIDSLMAAVERVSLFSEPDGLFIFDVNTPYKHRCVLGDNTFVYDMDGVYCVWQNSYYDEDCTVEMCLDIFVEDENGCYQRSTEEFAETAYPVEQLDEILDRAGFDVLAHYDFDSFNPPHEQSEKVVFVARKRTV